MNLRQSTYDIDPMILNRWSARAMSAEEMTDDELMPLFEAARWAPSSYNSQPWRFVYAKKNTPYWDAFLNLLVEANQVWAKKASALVLVLSRKNFEHNEKPARTHSFDAGLAFQNLALEGVKRGLVIHPMQGFDYKKAKEVSKAPDVYEVEVMVVIGKPGNINDLPENLREREKPSDRKSLETIVMEGELQ